MSPAPPRIVQRLARLLVRGPEAPYVLSDLDDAFDRDVSRGVRRASATRRYLVNVWASGWHLLLGRLRGSSLRLSWVDIRLGLRMLVKFPMLTVVALFALSVALPVSLAPLHLSMAAEAQLPEDPEGRVQLLRLVNGRTTIHDLERWRSSVRSLERIAGVREARYNLALELGNDPVLGAEVSSELFAILGTRPVMGRVLEAADEVPGAEPTVVIGHRLWQTTLGGRVDVTSTRIHVNGVPHRIVGVMPDTFQFPTRQELWLPLRDVVTSTPEQARGLRIIGQLRVGVSPDEAQRECAAVALAGVILAPGEHVVPEVVPTSFMVFNFPKGGLRATSDYQLAQTLTIVPLLVACLNVGLLIFARTSSRTSEFAVRAALGASRARILTQVFAESWVLVLLATGAGLWLLHWLPTRALTMAGVTLPYWLDPGLTPTIVAVGLVLGVVAAGLAGVVPVWRATRRSVQTTLQQSRAGSGGPRFGGVASALIVTDVAVAVAVIGVAVGVGRHITQTTANPEADGITAGHYLSFTLEQGASRRRDGDLLARLRTEPGVRGVAVATTLPRMEHQTTRVEVEGNAQPTRARMSVVAPEFFEALRHTPRAGRVFTSADLHPSAHTVIVNASFVANVLGGAPPIGKRVRLLASDPAAPPGPWLEIVGVVGHLGMRSINPEMDQGLYRPLDVASAEHVRVAVEVGGDPLSFVPRLRAFAAEVDPQAVVSEFRPLDAVYEGDYYLMSAAVVGALVLVGVLLTMATCAIYAIMSFTVAQRTREIGVRVALGADRIHVVLQVARQALVQITVGVVVGMLLTGTLLFEVITDSNPQGSTAGAVVLSLLPGVAMLVVIALASCAAPTFRALRISPVLALRSDG